MRSFRSVILFVILIESYLYAQNFNQTDSIPKFRSFYWEESFNDVKSREIAKYMQTYIAFGESILSYHGEIADCEARIDFVFIDGILVEGHYIIEVDSYEETNEKIKDYYFKKLGTPNYWASSHPNSKIAWIGDENEICRGPEIYWGYCDGFIAIIAEKYMKEITITIIYAHNKTIQEYGKIVTYPYEKILDN
jgi:hypothetical protein